MDPLFKKHKVENAYFPLFIPEKFLNLEKEHVEGFAPHMAVVTIAGGEELKERLVVRPTSETIMYEMYKRWTQSWRDLPILINQWNNIVRWEKRTYLFLRTSEFLWQEGHCAHITHDESLATVRWALDTYADTYQSLLALYGIAGLKSESEKFAGAKQTFSYEMLMPDGKALQGCTSHDLGQNFSKAFDWSVQDADGRQLFPWQNSWGFSTRSIGGLIMAHGDDSGLILPPNIAPIQVILIPIPGSSPDTIKYAIAQREELKKLGIRVKCDDKEGESAGFKFNKWEVRGVPVRLEIGDKEAKEGVVTAVRRDMMEKSKIRVGEIPQILKVIQDSLLAKHKKFTEENTHKVTSYEEFKTIMAGKRGFISAFWCEEAGCETEIKQETKASTRCLPLGAKTEKGTCIHCGKPATHRWIFAQAY
ncbi:proline--tRNA ligase [Candidatus Gottesmanbacteria bacterium]|nr:proline--tRNA ligase [Candidatus Gottesmanbacteria bacterium]